MAWDTSLAALAGWIMSATTDNWEKLVAIALNTSSLIQSQLSWEEWEWETGHPAGRGFQVPTQGTPQEGA